MQVANVRYLPLLGTCLLAPGWASLSMAQAPIPSVEASPHREPKHQIELRASTSVILEFEGLKRVSITNPMVADVAIMGVGELRVDGRSGGETSLYVWDQDGRREYRIHVEGGVDMPVADSDPRPRIRKNRARR